MTFWLMCLGAYALGSIPFAVLFTRNLVDIRKEGSGNIGATNVLRTAGKGRAVATLLCDMAKGFVPVFIALQMFDASDMQAAVVGSAAIVGHIVPIWLKGKGGKALATTLGVFLALNYWLALSVIAVWLVVMKVSGISSLGALVSVSLAPFIGWLLGMESNLITWLVAVWATLMLTHRENIERLCKGEEKAVKAAKKS